MNMTGPPGPSGNARILTQGLDQLLQALTDSRVAGPVERGLLMSCPACRNRLLYMLDTAPYAGSAYHQFGSRIRALPMNHEMHAGKPDHADNRFPVIRGLA